MNYFFLRFLPYLYYFVREQYRQDATAPEPTRKKRYIYRTVITLLIFALGLTLTFGTIKIRELTLKLALNENEVDVIKQQTVSGDMISRDRYEQDLHDLALEKYQWEYTAKDMATELNRVCGKKPSPCDQRTLHIIESFSTNPPKP